MLIECEIRHRDALFAKVGRERRNHCGVSGPANSLQTSLAPTEKKMGTFALRRGIRRSPLRWRRTPSSPLHRPVAAVSPSSSAASAAVAPPLEWPGKETRSQAEKLNDDRLEVLLPRLPHVGRALLKCDGTDHPCRLPICAVCARAYRAGPIAQLHAPANSYVGPHQVATIYLRLLGPGSLADADPSRVREMFRKRLDRAGFKNGILVGGIEVAWQEDWQRWIVHAHVHAIGVHEVTWKQLEAALKDSGTARPVVPKLLRDPDEQLSYCIKFVTYHQPGRRLVPFAGGSPRRTRGVVLALSFRGFLLRLWRSSSRRPPRRR